MAKKGDVKVEIPKELREELDKLVNVPTKGRWDPQTSAILEEYVRKVPNLMVLLAVMETARPELTWSITRVSEGVRLVTGKPWTYWKNLNIIASRKDRRREL